MTDANAPVSVVFVCWGNICRSPMAERIARAQASAKHHDGIVFTSAGVSSEEFLVPQAQLHYQLFLQYLRPLKRKM